MEGARESARGQRLQSYEQARNNGGETNGFTCQLVTCRLDELQPHPSYARHRLTVSSSQLSALIARGDLAFREPIVISRDRKVIDGYARLDLARQQGQDTILCIEHDLSEEESLRWLVQTHLPHRGLNAYCRILFALDLEPSFRRQARANQQAGGQNKGSSNLTEANVRKEIAKAAGVSEGNVTKVDQLRNAAPDVLKALHKGDVRIHRAWLWRKLNPEQQREQLRLYQIQRGLKHKVTTLISKHRTQTPKAANPALTMADLDRLAERLPAILSHEHQESDPTFVGLIDTPGKVIFLSIELYQATSSQEGAK